MMRPQLSSSGIILNAAVLTAEDVAHKGVLCPACMEKEFERWPEGWEAHAAHWCKGLSRSTPQERITEFERVLGHLLQYRASAV